jgi:hypothetical protein
MRRTSKDDQQQQIAAMRYMAQFSGPRMNRHVADRPVLPAYTHATQIGPVADTRYRGAR